MRFFVKIIFVFCFALNSFIAQTVIPEIKEDDPEFKKAREKWFDDMHRSEPGVNWKVIEFANRIAKREQILSKLKNSEKAGNVIQRFDNVADGYIRGKWTEKGSNNLAGRIHNVDIDWDRNFIYAASSGGNIWRGNIDGTGWICLNNSFQIPNIRAVYVKKFQNYNRIFVVGNGPSSCFFSDDEGLIWQKSNGFDKAARWGNLHRSVRIANSDLIYVLANEWDYEKWRAITTIYKSVDFGSNFKEIYRTTTDVSKCDIYSPKAGSTDFYFAHFDTLSKIATNDSLTNISNFSSLGVFQKMTNILLKGSAEENSNQLAVMLNIGDGRSYFYRSSDGGISWTQKGSVEFTPFERNSFEVSYFDPENLFVGGTEVYRSDDGGSTWKKVNGWGEYYGNMKYKLHADIPGIQCFKSSKGGEMTFIGTDGGLYKSEDNALTVTNISLYGLNVSQYYGSYTYKNEKGIIFVGAQDQGFQRCLNDSGSAVGFQQTISGDYGHLSSSDGGDHLWSVYPGFAMLYVNANLDKFSSYYWDLNKNSCKNWLWMPPIIGDPSNPQAAYLAAGGIGCTDGNKCSYMFHLVFDGSSVSHTILPYNFGADGSRLSAMAISELNKDYFYCLTNNGNFYYSSDKGSNWTKTDSLKGPEAHYFYGSTVLASKLNLGKIVIAGSGYSNPGAFLSLNHGKTFDKIDSGLPKTLIYKIAMSEDEKYIYAATEAGPFIYIFEHKKWFSLSSTNSPDQTFWSVEYVPQLQSARFVTYGRGIWDFKIEEVLSLPENNEPKTNFNISAYPTPASDKIHIKTDNEIRSGNLSIYNYNGKLINKFELKNISALSEFDWNCSDFSGRKVESGNYLCIITSEGTVQFCKIIIE